MKSQFEISSSRISAAAFAAALLVATANVQAVTPVDSALLALDADAELALEKMGIGPGPVANDSRAQLNAFEDTYGILDTANVVYVDDGQASTLEVYLKAKNAYDTLKTRCDYIYNNAGPQLDANGNFVREDQVAVAKRTQALIQSFAVPTQSGANLGRANKQTIGQYLDNFDAMLATLQARGYPALIDPTKDIAQYTTLELYLAANDVHHRACLACGPGLADPAACDIDTDN